MLVYLMTNPVILAALGALLVFLTIDRFRDLSSRVGDVSNQVVQFRTSLNEDVKTASESVSKDLQAEWDRVRNKLDAIKRENPWVDSISQFEFNVNVPTAGAALRNIDQFMANNDPHIAYEVLYEASLLDRGPDLPVVQGNAANFEILAFLSLALFSDNFICDRHLLRAEAAASRLSAAWKGRRLIFAVLNGQLVDADRLSAELESLFRPSLGKSLLSYFGIRDNIVPLPDYHEAIAALAIHDHYVDSKQSRRRRAWLNSEVATLPAWAATLIEEGSLRLTSPSSAEGDEFIKLAQSANARASFILAHSHYLMSTGQLDELEDYIASLHIGRPGLSFLKRSRDQKDETAGTPRRAPKNRQPTRANDGQKGRGPSVQVKAPSGRVQSKSEKADRRKPPS